MDHGHTVRAMDHGHTVRARGLETPSQSVPVNNSGHEACPGHASLPANVS